MLEKLFFNREMVKVIEHFIIHEKWQQNKKDLCISLEIPWRSMFGIIARLLDFKLIKIIKSTPINFYKINRESKLLPFLRGLSQEFGMQEALRMEKVNNNVKY